MNQCRDYIRIKGSQLLPEMTYCDVCVNNSKTGCKLHGDNHKTDLVHAPVRNSGRNRVFR